MRSVVRLSLVSKQVLRLWRKRQPRHRSNRGPAVELERSAQFRRLAGIDNIDLSTGQYSNFAFTTTPENFITAIGETSDATTVYPVSLTQTASYNNLNQLTNLSDQALSFDADGNLTADGLRNYSWDAENPFGSGMTPVNPRRSTYAPGRCARRTGCRRW
ncbi:MAG: hypothetical protein WCA56_07630 [Xanthobacteraceae bacterium]